MRVPKPLNFGDRVGVVAPCYTCEKKDSESFVRGIEAQGLTPVLSPHLLENTEGFAAALTDRIADFNAMLEDDSITMILFDGGEVCNQLLPNLNYNALRRNPKWVASYSDGTSILNALSALCQVEVLYGPAPSVLASGQKYSIDCFRAFAFGRGTDGLPPVKARHTIRSGRASGQLIGGYLVNFALMTDSDYLPLLPDSDYLLFLEDRDCFNSVAAVARYLWSIGQSRLMRQVKGLVIGSYSDPSNQEFLSLCSRFATAYQLPCFQCDEFGHGAEHGILPIGRMAHLDADACALTYDPV